MQLFILNIAFLTLLIWVGGAAALYADGPARSLSGAAQAANQSPTHLLSTETA